MYTSLKLVKNYIVFRSSLFRQRFPASIAVTHFAHAFFKISSSSRGKCWKTIDLMYWIKTGFNFIFPSTPPTFDLLRVSSSKISRFNLVAKFFREQLFFLRTLIFSSLSNEGGVSVTVTLSLTGGISLSDSTVPLNSPAGMMVLLVCAMVLLS